MPVIIKKPIEVANRLDARFSLSREQLLDVIGVMVGARRDCTDNDPAGSVGWASYQHGTRRLREVSMPSGYRKDATDQIEAAAHDKLKIKIVIANTNAGTGLEEYEPKNLSQKGAATDRAISPNQTTFISLLEAQPGVVNIRLQNTDKNGYLTWYFCLYHDGDEVRAELSLPKDVENGFFKDFIERIIIVGREGFDGTAIKRDDDDGATSEFDIPVSRK